MRLQWSPMGIVYSRIRSVGHVRRFATSPLLSLKHTVSRRQETLQDLLLERNPAHRTNFGDNELLRCTMFDVHGNVTAMSRDFRRKDLFTQLKLLPRDLRKIDKGQLDMVPSILMRENSILVSILYIRALIKADSVILFDAHGSADSFTQHNFTQDLENKLKLTDQESGLPYEIRALEAILVSVLSSLEAELKVHRTVIKGILDELDTYIEPEKLRYLLIQNKRISAFQQKTKLIRELVDDILAQDDELNGLYLTEKLKGTPRIGTNHAEAEFLLENYFKHIDEIVQNVDNLISHVKTTEEIINIVLDSNRNELMFLSLKFSIGLLGLGFGMYLSSIYGMNLENFIEEKDWGFEIVCGVTMIGVVMFVVYGVRRLNRLQKVTMTGDDLRVPLSSVHLRTPKDM